MEALSKENRIKYFDTLLSGLSEMEDDGYIHQVFIAILEGIDGDENLRLLAEALHQRWLSDTGFAPVAARLAQRLAELKAEEGDVSFSSLVFANIMNDYNDRFGLRRTSKTVFCNSSHFTFEFYALFQTAGELYQSLVGPLFEYLRILLSPDATDVEIELMSQLVLVHGPVLQQLDHNETQELCLKIRRVLIENNDITCTIRYRLLEIIELSQNRWDPELLPLGVSECYRTYHREKKPAGSSRHFSVMIKPAELLAFNRPADHEGSMTPSELSSYRMSPLHRTPSSRDHHTDMSDTVRRKTPVVDDGIIHYSSLKEKIVTRAASFKLPQRSNTLKVPKRSQTFVVRPSSSHSLHEQKDNQTSIPSLTPPKIVIENGNGRLYRI